MISRIRPIPENSPREWSRSIHDWGGIHCRARQPDLNPGQRGLRSVPEPHRTRYRVGALCWILGLEWFVGQAIAQAAWTTPYSLTRNFVSDLGAASCRQVTDPTYQAYVCSPLHVVMNLAFIALGLLSLVGLVLLRPLWPRRRRATIGFVGLALFGLGKIDVGLSPEDVRPVLHTLGALGILWGNLALVFLSLATWRTGRWAARVSLGVGTVGAVAFVLLVMASRLHLDVGIVERLAAYPLPIWLAVLGARILRHREARIPQ